MGLDLTLLVVTSIDNKWGFAHTILEVFRRRDLFGEIEILEQKHGKQVPNIFHTYFSTKADGENGYGEVKQTPYGSPLLMIDVVHLAQLYLHNDVNDNITNRAIWAYLSVLKPDTQIALYWH